MTKPRVRQAERADAAAMSDVLTRSIVELCGADHKNDPEHLKSWLENKSESGVLTWFDNGVVALRVTETQNGIGAVGGFKKDGEIALLYVAPELRGQGHSSTLLAAMEAELAALGLKEARLMSSRTAERFYERQGWQTDGQRSACYSTSGQPMKKIL